MSIKSKFATFNSRFYNYKINFNKFNDIDSEDIIKFQSLVEKYKEKENFDDILKKDKLEAYTKVLSYLTSTNDWTFDEKVVFLILTMDEKLELLKAYFSVDFITSDNINNEEDELKKQLLKDMQKSQLFTFKNYCRKMFGFYNRDFIIFEKIFFNKFVKKNELVTNYSKDESNKLYNKHLSSDIFDYIREDEYNDIKNKVVEYQKKCPNPTYELVIYHLIYQNELLKIDNYYHKLLFLILVIDPNLKILQIHEEECTIKSRKRRMLDELKYYHEELISIEKAYVKKFAPNTSFFI